MATRSRLPRVTLRHAGRGACAVPQVRSQATPRSARQSRDQSRGQVAGRPPMSAKLDEIAEGLLNRLFSPMRDRNPPAAAHDVILEALRAVLDDAVADERAALREIVDKKACGNRC